MFHFVSRRSKWIRAKGHYPLPFCVTHGARSHRHVPVHNGVHNGFFHAFRTNESFEESCVYVSLLYSWLLRGSECAASPARCRLIGIGGESVGFSVGFPVLDALTCICEISVT